MDVKMIERDDRPCPVCGGQMVRAVLQHRSRELEITGESVVYRCADSTPQHIPWGWRPDALLAG